MKTGTLVGLVAVTAGALYFLSRYKRPKGKVIVDEQLASENKTSRKNLTEKEKSTINGLNFGIPISINKSRVKAPIVIPSQNLVPDVYGNKVGQEMYFNGNDSFYNNISGNATVSIQKACNCATKSVRYKTDLPKLP